MGNNCKICNDEFGNIEDFHKHLKTHKVTQKKYYLKHYPKKDPFDGKDIEYRNAIQYLETEYNSLSNLISHLKSVSKKEGQKICEKIISQRAAKKGLKFSPSQVESKSLNMPPVSFLIDYLDDYTKTFDKHNLETRYSYVDSYIGFNNTKEKILIDTREQTPILFENSKVQKLNYGDYTLERDTSLVIERKSLNDFIGTLSKGYDRFVREIQGGIVNQCYFIVLVEAPISTALNFHKMRQFNRFCKSSGGFIFHKLRSITEEYRNVQFMFVNDRKESKDYIEKLLGFGRELVSRMDLQYNYDKNII